MGRTGKLFWCQDAIFPFLFPMQLPRVLWHPRCNPQEQRACDSRNCLFGAFHQQLIKPMITRTVRLDRNSIKNYLRLNCPIPKRDLINCDQRTQVNYRFELLTDSLQPVAPIQQLKFITHLQLIFCLNCLQDRCCTEEDTRLTAKSWGFVNVAVDLFWVARNIFFSTLFSAGLFKLIFKFAKST